MKALLIDPWQKKIHSLDIPHELQAWYAVLRCDCVDVACVGVLPNGRRVDVWVDDNGFIAHDQHAPCFRIGEATLCGYGLVLESDRQGVTHGVSFERGYFSGKLSFERWEKRLDPADHFEELTRVPSWEHV